MPTHIPRPSRVEASGNKPKLIDEYIGRINSKNEAVSIAHMQSPGGWQESGQTPEFDEFTVPSTSPYVFPLFPWQRCTGMESSSIVRARETGRHAGAYYPYG